MTIVTIVRVESVQLTGSGGKLMINSKLWRLLAIIFAVSLVAASCSSDSGTDTADGGDDAPAATDAPDDGDDDEPADTEAPDDTEAPAATDAPAEDLEPVKIGLIAQDEELFAFPEVRAAAEAYVAYLNAEQSGIDGHPVELVICGAGDAPEGHVACAQEMVNDDSVHIVVTGGFLGNSAAATPILSDAGKATLTLGNDFVDYFVPNTYVFDPGLPGLAQVFFVFAAAEGIETMSLFIADDPAFEPFIPVLEAIASSNGITITETIPLGFEPDLTGPVSAADTANDSWLFVLGDGSQCSAASAGVDTVGFEGRKFANDLCMGQDIVESGVLDGWSGPIVSSAPTVDGKDIAEISRILDTYGGADAQTAGLSGWALASTQIAADALSQAGAGDATDASVVDVMNSYSSDSILGFPPVVCPGQSAWTGACNTSPLMVTVVDGTMTTPDGFTTLDFSELDFLLE